MLDEVVESMFDHIPKPSVGRDLHCSPRIGPSAPLISRLTSGLNSASSALAVFPEQPVIKERVMSYRCCQHSKLARHKKVNDVIL